MSQQPDFLFKKGSSRGRINESSLALYQPGRKDNKTSVFRVIGLNEHSIWALGDKHVAVPQRRAILARAELNVSEICAVGLVLEADNKSYRHANIAGWPAGKSEWKLLAQELAAYARLTTKD